MTKFIEHDPEQPLELPSADGARQCHLFAQPDIDAVNSALAARRPLLLRGEPGVGKTQLAHAAAVALARPIVSFTVDARTESHDLMWSFDAVRRLAEAQLCSVLAKDNPDGVADRLDERRFIQPGPLWWGFQWDKANEHLTKWLKQTPRACPDGITTEHGCVVLIDEIDKANTDVPNGLLEALGSGRFQPPGCDEVVAGKAVPLVVITTNEERMLPDAFVRRCLVHELSLPEDPDKLKDVLTRRAAAHFPEAPSTLLTETATMLVEDRKRPKPGPGLAEYLDLIRAVAELAEHRKIKLQEGDELNELIQSVRRFTLKKHSGAES